MMRTFRRSAAALALLILPGARLAWPSGDSPQARLESALPGLRVSRADLGVRPERWDTLFKLKAVEDLLDDPLKIPAAAEGWSAELSSATSSADLLALSSRFLGLVHGSLPAASSAGGRVPSDAGLPAGLADAVNGLLAAMDEARPFLDAAVASLPEPRRGAALKTVLSFVRNEQDFRPATGDFESAGLFEEESLLRAADLVARAADDAEARLRGLSGSTFPTRRWRFPAGDVLVTGQKEQTFSEDDLRGVALVVGLGGNRRYAGAPAAAGPGELRVVLDFGRDVTVDASAAGAGPGSGTFGIGLLYLPNPEGAKRLDAGDVSLGAGVFGAGGLFVRGSSVTLRGGRFTQGSGAFGLGFLDVKGASVTLSADMAGQGFGFTRGVGLFKLAGDGARVHCGLTEPDPREDLATIGLCQGVGDGPRAFAAGGIGLASLRGDGMDVRSGYFAQGAGYWHGFGGLSVVGNENHLQARRYDQGSGIHTAVGALLLKRDRDSTATWGVGPAYGWDWGVGYFDAEGSDDAFYGEWGAGHGDINGRSLSFIRGDRDRIQLPDFGSGAFKRNAPSYGLALVEGEGSRYRWSASSAAANSFSIAFDPWSRLEGSLALDPGLELPKPVWPAVDRAAAAVRDSARLAGRLDASAALPEDERIGDWLSIASDFGLDARAPGTAARRLASSSSENGARLVRQTAPERFDEFIWLRALVPGFGKSAVSEIAAELPAARGTRKVMLLSYLRSMRADAAPLLLAEVSDADWRVRREAVVGLGALFDREGGEEPGRVRFLEAAETLCRRRSPLVLGGKDEKALEQRAGIKRLGDLLGALALLPALPAERQSMLEHSPGPIDPVDGRGWVEFARLLSLHRDSCGAFEKERKEGAIEDKARAAVLGALSDLDPEVREGAVSSLAQLGRKEDAVRIAAHLEDPAAVVREGAAAALGKLGASGRSALRKALGAPSPRTRALAAIGIAMTADPDVFGDLRRAFADRDPAVRLAAVSSLAAVQAPVRVERARLRKDLATLASRDADPSVREASSLQLTRLSP